MLDYDVKSYIGGPLDDDGIKDLQRLIGSIALGDFPRACGSQSEHCPCYRLNGDKGVCVVSGRSVEKDYRPDHCPLGSNKGSF